MYINTILPHWTFKDLSWWGQQNTGGRSIWQKYGFFQSCHMLQPGFIKVMLNKLKYVLNILHWFHRFFHLAQGPNLNMYYNIWTNILLIDNNSKVWIFRCCTIYGCGNKSSYNSLILSFQLYYRDYIESIKYSLVFYK